MAQEVEEDPENKFSNALTVFCNTPFTRTTYMMLSIISIFFGLFMIWTMYDFPLYCESYDTQDAKEAYHTNTIFMIIVGSIFIFDGSINLLWNVLVFINPVYSLENDINSIERSIIAIFLLAMASVFILDSVTTVMLIQATINCNTFVAAPFVFIVLWTNAILFSLIAWGSIVMGLIVTAMAIFVILLPFILCGFICKEIIFSHKNLEVQTK